MRLTQRMLDAIVEMSCIIEAGFDSIQGVNDESKQAEILEACADAGTWAAQETRKRRKRREQKKVKSCPS